MLIALLALHWWDAKHSDSVLADVIDSFLSSIKQLLSGVKDSAFRAPLMMCFLGKKGIKNRSKMISILGEMIWLNKWLKGKASEWLHSIWAFLHCTQITLETSAHCSLCYKMSMKMLMVPNTDRWRFSIMNMSMSKAEIFFHRNV